MYYVFRFDTELNAARDETSQERLAKEQLIREKATMKSDADMLQQELNVSSTFNSARAHAHTRTNTCTHIHTCVHAQAQYTTVVQYYTYIL